MSYNFFKTAVLTNFGDIPVLKFLQTLALHFSCICLQFSPGNFSQQEENVLPTNV